MTVKSIDFRVVVSHNNFQQIGALFPELASRDGYTEGQIAISDYVKFFGGEFSRPIKVSWFLDPEGPYKVTRAKKDDPWGVGLIGVRRIRDGAFFPNCLLPKDWLRKRINRSALEV